MEEEEEKNKETRSTAESPVEKTPPQSPKKDEEKQEKNNKPSRVVHVTISEPPEVFIIPSPCYESQEPQCESGEEHGKKKEPNNKRSKWIKPIKIKKRKEKREIDNEDGEEGAFCRFSLTRIKRVIRRWFSTHSGCCVSCQ